MEIAIAFFFADLREAAPSLTTIIVYVANCIWLKGGVLMALLILSSIKSRPKVFSSLDLHLVRSGAAIFIAIFLSRLLQLLLPHRDRPLVVTSPEKVTVDFDQFSSFPSDHAVLMTCIATATLFRNRTLGIIAIAWAILIIFMPRIYLGLHHSSDIIAGMAMGAGICWAVMQAPLPRYVHDTVAGLEQRHARALYFLAGVFTIETIRNFEDLRAAARLLLNNISG